MFAPGGPETNSKPQFAPGVNTGTGTRSGALSAVDAFSTYNETLYSLMNVLDKNKRAEPTQLSPARLAVVGVVSLVIVALGILNGKASLTMLGSLAGVAIGADELGLSTDLSPAQALKLVQKDRQGFLDRKQNVPPIVERRLAKLEGKLGAPKPAGSGKDAPAKPKAKPTR